MVFGQIGGHFDSGKKWASGTSNVASSTKTFEYLGNKVKAGAYYIEITGLIFKPSVVVAYVNGVYGRPVSILVPFNDGHCVYTFTPNNTSTSTTSISFKADYNVFVNDSTMHLPIANSANYSFVWYAFE